jgi:hypothetical protein
MATRIKVYDSVQDMADDADRAFQKGKVHKSDAEIAGRGHWIGRQFDSWAEALDAASQTWEEGVGIISRMAESVAGKIGTQPRSRKRRTAWSEDSGDEIDIDRVRSGQAPWRTCQRQETTAQQIITLVADIGANCGVDHKSILWRGAAAVVLAGLLEEAGYRVEIYAMRSGRGMFKCVQDDALTAWKIKRADQPLDVATLAAAVSGWFFRTVVFQSWYTLGLAVRESLGMSMSLTEANVSEAIPGAQSPIIISNVWSEEAAMEFIRRQIERFQ